jgi:two-component sensor histidine kinase
MNAIAPSDPLLAYRLRQQSLLADFGLVALCCRDFDMLLQRATEMCADGMHAQFGKVLEYLPAENRFLVRAGIGWAAGVVGQATIGADLESPAGYALKTGAAVISNHLNGESRFRTPKLLAEHGVKRAINVIIRSQEECEPFGVLEVDSASGGQFDEADLAFMQGFANLLGVAIERQNTESLMRQATEHQQILTREVSHRVKNSLALVASLLGVQARAAKDDEVRRALTDAEARVATIAEVHDQLWRRGDVRQVDLSEFLGDLCEKLQETAPQHRLVFEGAGPILAPTDQAVPLGLLVNELVTNAFKYAYPAGPGEVRVSLRREGSGRILLEVADCGRGLPPDFDLARPNGSLGMRLIRGFARQLGADMQVSSVGGARFTFTMAGEAGERRRNSKA